MTVPPTQSQNVFTVVDTKLSGQEIHVKENKKNKVLEWCATNWKAIVAEVVATTSLLLFGCMGQCKLDGVETPPLYGPLGFGTVVAMNIQMFGHISGAHMNPAVSLGSVIFGTMSIPLAIAYSIAQCCGAIIGFGLLNAVVANPLMPDGMCSTIPRDDLNVAQALGIEIFLTAALNFVNCGVWDSRNKHLQDSIPVKFGLVITGLSIAGGPLTGASMNPARSLGPALWNGTWQVHWVYWVGPLLGGAFSAVLYRIIWKPNDEKPSIEEQPLDSH